MPTERIREHAGQGATTVAAHRRRLRADQARQLADLLRQQVLTGGFPDGTLPHETAIGADYRTTRNTVRQALDLLRAEGLVERLPG
ncbi:GntR family transcriptional regulator, partial [Streptomyces anthocyanicus]